VGTDACFNAALAQGGEKFANDVAVRAHILGVPARDRGGVHREAVMVFGDGDDVAGAGLDEQIGPGFRVPLLRLEERDEILVAELGDRPPGCFVMGKDGLWLAGGFAEGVGTRALVHAARIPFVAECGDGVGAPVKKDAELSVGEPLRDAILAERIPIGVEALRLGGCGNRAGDSGDGKGDCRV
jgi:hypothetical protein